MSELTPREKEILELLAEGITDREIAYRLGISAYTVRTHVKHVREALGARTRWEAVAKAYRAGVLSHGREVEDTQN